METPFIPESAPFTPAQRAWLNGFLAGMFSTTPANARSPLLVLFGSQTGTAERLSKKLAREASAAGFEARVVGLDACSPELLAGTPRAALVVSTHGDGDPPDQALSFFRTLHSANAPRLEGLEYAVLALGDSTYQHFAKCGRDLDARLAELGAKRAIERVDADVDVDTPFGQWKTALFHTWKNGTGTPAEISSGTDPVPAEQTRIEVPIVRSLRLNRGDSDKHTRHLALRLTTQLNYSAGDALAVMPRNPTMMVDEVLRAVGYDGEEAIRDLDGCDMALRRALAEKYTIGRLSAKTVRTYGEACGNQSILELCADALKLREYLEGRDLIDLLLDAPPRFPDANAFLAVLPRLVPRLYSIASSPYAHPDEVHVCVAVVRYRSHARERLGICSTYVGERKELGDTLEVFVQPNERFRPPSPETPLIMIGPGTGIAPFRAFLAERRAIGATGRNWLFFGDRHRETDFLYEDELTAYEADGFARLSLAFSRDQHHKVYVQHLMVDSASEFWRWLEEGASVYVCGDATHMAKDVENALLRVIEIAGGLSVDEASEYVDELRASGRYRRDVY